MVDEAVDEFEDDSADIEAGSDDDLSESASESESDSDSHDIDVDYSLTAKEKERLELQQQIEEFLSRGGKINHIESNVTGDPPQKPSSNYGSRPI
ncbi:hypothetical protein [Sessilibacter sp. MAH4]